MFESVLNKSVEPIRWLIVMGIAYTLATTIWTFLAAPTPTPTAGAQRAPTAPTSAKRDPGNVNWILGKNLFGEAGAAPVVAQVDNSSVAEPTRLPLELQSVMVATDPALSTAIVAQKGRSGLLYRVGENVPGNAELVEVLGDRVILRRAGNREALLFPKPDLSLIAQQPYQEPEPSYEQDEAGIEASISEESDAPVDDGMASTVDEYKQRLAEDASGTLNELGIEPVDSGGYRVGDLASSPYLRNTGLQPGDVVLSINGRPVGDIEQDRLELDNIMAQGSARIEVQRGDRRFFITASL